MTCSPGRNRLKTAIEAADPELHVVASPPPSSAAMHSSSGLAARIVRAPIRETARPFAIDVTLERRAHLNRRGDGAGGAFNISSDMDRQGFELIMGLPDRDRTLYCSPRAGRFDIRRRARVMIARMSSSKPRVIDVPDLPPPNGHYAYGIEHGGVIYASGQLGRGPGMTRCGGRRHLPPERASAWRRSRRCCARRTAILSRLLKVNITIVNMDDWPAVNAVYSECWERIARRVR